MVTVDLNIPVICYGLRSDFSLKGFPGSTRLLELAHTIEEMKTICTCGRKATCISAVLLPLFMAPYRKYSFAIVALLIKRQPSLLVRGERAACFL